LKSIQCSAVANEMKTWKNSSLRNQASPEVELLEEVAVSVKPTHSIVLYNDDVNTFEHVIEMLMAYCEHQPEQAEQCAYIVHYNGKCSVKNGEYKKLEPICSALLEKGLSAQIEN
jgi:ATP-dependent Clp protease adaptor protein ClpS